MLAVELSRHALQTESDFVGVTFLEIDWSSTGDTPLNKPAPCAA